jgi:Ser/Thr protein kinase RdoA (MazF antagonist)
MSSVADRVPGVLARYPGLAGVRARLIRASLNETYRVEGNPGSVCVLKVYRAGFRTAAQVEAELGVIGHFARSGLRVGVPVPDSSGDLMGILPSPDGDRPYVLFEALPGAMPSLDDDCAGRFGEFAALLHDAGEKFLGLGSLGRLDTDHLVRAPIAVLEPHLGDRRDWLYLTDLAERLADWVEHVAPGLSWGFCHGDLHGGNSLLDGDRLSVFDFEFCGVGFQAYDLAVFRWIVEIHAVDRTPQLWEAFCRGYSGVRPLPEEDRRASGPFVLVRHLWDLAIDAQMAPGPGRIVIGTEVLEQFLSHLPIWEATFLGHPANGA